MRRPEPLDLRHCEQRQFARNCLQISPNTIFVSASAQTQAVRFFWSMSIKNIDYDSSASNGAKETTTSALPTGSATERKKCGFGDPPYIGQAHRHYSHDPRCAEVDHEELIRRLDDNYDGWGLSCSSPSLRMLLPLCPPDVRVAAWVKPFASFKAANPAFAWESVIYKPCRTRKGRFIMRDWVAPCITLKRGLCGVKPDRFSFWLFEILGMEPEDQFDDLFPGSGAVTRAWGRWRDFELERRITGEPVGLYAQEKDLALFADKPNRLGSIARLMGHKGGRSTSEAKSRAARANGALGGRPRNEGHEWTAWPRRRNLKTGEDGVSIRVKPDEKIA